MCLGPADAFELVFWSTRRIFTWSWGSCPRFRQENGSAVGQLEPPSRVRMALVNAPFSWRTARFQQLFPESPRSDRISGLFRRLLFLVDGPGDQLLAVPDSRRS